MPPTALAGAYAKIEWAKKHASQFDALDTTLTAANKDLIAHKDDPKTGQRRYYISQEPVIPVGYSLLIADVVHNLRSALDHIAYALCLAGPGGQAAITDERQRRIQFPITRGDAENYRALPARGEIKGLAKPGAVDQIDAAEPYKGGVGQPLVQLSALDNTDKHRLLLTVALQTPLVNIVKPMVDIFRQTNPNIADGIGLYIGPTTSSALKAGDDLFVTSGGTFHPQMDFAIAVTLNEPQIAPIEPVGELLEKLTKHVSGLVPKFGPFV